MVQAFAFAALLAALDPEPPQSAPAPSPSQPGAAPLWSQPSPPPGWTTRALGEGEFAHFVRTEGDGRLSEVIATHRVCNCQPAEIVAELAVVFRDSFVTVEQSKTPMCGIPTERLSGSKPAPKYAGGALRDVDVRAFRMADSLVVIELVTPDGAPAGGTEAAMESVCTGIAS